MDETASLLSTSDDAASDVGISVHDNTLNSYCVDAGKEEIRLCTSFAAQGLQEYSDVIFTGVVAYRFGLDNFGTIIFDVYETNLESIYTDNRELFEYGRKYCWPGTWNASDESVLDYLIANEIKGYQISSAIGLTGWVLAESMAIVSTAS